MGNFYFGKKNRGEGPKKKSNVVFFKKDFEEDLSDSINY